MSFLSSSSYVVTPTQVLARVASQVRNEESLAAGLGRASADAARFDAAAERLYCAMGRAWHGSVVWADSPFSAALSALLASLATRGCFRDALTPLWAVEVGQVLWSARQGRWGWPLSEECDALDEVTVRSADALVSMVAEAVDSCLHGRERGRTLHEIAHVLSAEASSRPLGGLVREMLRHLFEPDRQAEANAQYAAAAHAVQQASGRALERLTSQGDMAWALAHVLMGGRGALYFGEYLGLWLHQQERLEAPGRIEACCRALADMSVWAFACWPHQEFLIACRHPLFMRLELASDQWQETEARLHCEDGPALAWSDGWQIHALQGKWIMHRWP